MTTVFLSYSTKDYFFAELAEIKLAASGIRLWRDQDQLLAGLDWRQGIERGIEDSLAVIVALSANSADSSYVTYEWAYAMGKGRPVIPLLIGACTMHPKLEPIQHLTFTNPGALPWDLLAERIREIETESEPAPAERQPAKAAPPDPDEATIKAILAYLNQRGYRTASFERLRRRVDAGLTDERFRQIIAGHPTVFRPAALKGGVPGLAKLVP